MDSEWYIQSNAGHVEGPLSASTLKTMVQQGQVTPTTLVRQGIEGNWVSACHVNGLFVLAPNDSEVCDWLTDQQPSESSATADRRTPEVSLELLPVSQEIQMPAATVAQPVNSPFPSPSSCLTTSPPLPEHSASNSQPTTEPTKPSRLILCVDCGKLISRTATLCPHCGWQGINPPRPDEHFALQFIATVNRFLALLVAAVCFVALMCVSNDRDTARPEVLTPLILYMILGPLALWGTAELILLLIGIANNTSTLRCMTVEQRMLFEQRVHVEEEERQARYEKAKRKLSPDLHAVLGQTGSKVAVEVEMVVPVSIGSFGSPLGYLDFEIVDDRSGLERFLGQETRRLRGYIALERIADLALSSVVERVSTWQHPASRRHEP